MWKKVRKFLNDIHLWLGLASGIVLFIVCLTGTILTFEKEIEGFFAGGPSFEYSSPALPINELSYKLEQQGYPIISGFTIPQVAQSPYQFYVKKDSSQRRSSSVLVNPTSGEVFVAPRTAADEIMSTSFYLHRWLLMDIPVGRPIVGIATIIFILLSISGLVIWFPTKVKWSTVKQGFKVKTDANWKRINHDLHNSLGFYTCLFLLLMGITGLCWSFPQYRDGLSAVIGTKVFSRNHPEMKPTYDSTSIFIEPSDVLRIAQSHFDQKGDLYVSLPSKRNDYYTIRKYNEQYWSPKAADYLYLDKTGKLLFSEEWGSKPFNEQFAAMIKPIHTGEVFGTFSKIIYFIVCLIGTSLPVTGTIIWINKLKKKKRRKSRELQTELQKAS